MGEAEAKVHGVEIRKVHFHEVGAIDSIADIVGSAIALDLLRIERIEASPVPTGFGFIEIAHGRVSIPAPATAELLKGIPLAESKVEAELTTPTGAAILAALCQGFGPAPAMTVQSIGYGAGTADFPLQSNLLRVLVGESGEPANIPGIETETVCQLETNIDDVSGEIVGHCFAQLLEAGALDVFSTAIQMKKNRPGVLLSVMCQPSDAAQMEASFLLRNRHVWHSADKCLATEITAQPHEVETPWGKIAGVLATLPGGEKRFSPEYESCRKIAAEKKFAAASYLRRGDQKRLFRLADWTIERR